MSCLAPHRSSLPASWKLCSASLPASWKLNAPHLQSPTSLSFLEAPHRLIIVIASFLEAERLSPSIAYQLKLPGSSAAVFIAIVASFLEAERLSPSITYQPKLPGSFAAVSSPASWKLNASHLQSPTSPSFQEAPHRLIIASFLEAERHSPSIVYQPKLPGSSAAVFIASSPASWKLSATHLQSPTSPSFQEAPQRHRRQLHRQLPGS